MVPLSYYLVLSAVLFACGVAGFMVKRNIITIFMSIELMLNAVNLSFVAFAAHWQSLHGQVFVFFVMVVAAAEAAVGLAIIISVFRTRETLNVDRVKLLKLQRRCSPFALRFSTEPRYGVEDLARIVRCPRGIGPSEYVPRPEANGEKRIAKSGFKLCTYTSFRC